TRRHGERRPHERQLVSCPLWCQQRAAAFNCVVRTQRARARAWTSRRKSDRLRRHRHERWRHGYSLQRGRSFPAQRVRRNARKRGREISHGTRTLRKILLTELQVSSFGLSRIARTRNLTRLA